MAHDHRSLMFRNRFPTGAPPLEMQVMTKERRVGVELADDLPNYSGHSGKFMLKLIAAWIAMGFRRPEITLGRQYVGRSKPPAILRL
jgi:hypothetical protein